MQTQYHCSMLISHHMPFLKQEDFTCQLNFHDAIKMVGYASWNVIDAIVCAGFFIIITLQ